MFTQTLRSVNGEIVVELGPVSFVVLPAIDGLTVEVNQRNISVGIIRGKKDGRKLHGYELWAHIDLGNGMARKIKLTREQERYLVKGEKIKEHMPDFYKHHNLKNDHYYVAI